MSKPRGGGGGRLSMHCGEHGVAEAHNLSTAYRNAGKQAWLAVSSPAHTSALTQS